MQTPHEVHLDQRHRPGHAPLESEQVYFCCAVVSMGLEVFDADGDAFHRVEEIGLKDQRLAWVVEHLGSVFGSKS